jgi:hypothetical protein
LVDALNLYHQLMHEGQAMQHPGYGIGVYIYYTKIFSLGELYNIYGYGRLGLAIIDTFVRQYEFLYRYA